MTVGIFAREGPFRSKMGISQVVSQLRNGLGGLRNGTRVPGGGFAGEGLWLRNLALEGFAAHFIATKWAFGLQNGTCVPRSGFVAAKNFVKGGVTPQFFFLMIIIIYSSTKELILKYSISVLKNLNVEFLLEFVQKEDMENLL